MRKSIICLLVGTFFAFSIGPMPGYGQAALPVISSVASSGAAMTAMVKGLTIHSDNPAQFDLIVEPGNTPDNALKEQSFKLIKYFLASITTPENDMWVNLSPYEKNRIIPDAFGQTLMGRDLLAQDYILKQITASLIHPDSDAGKKFWAKVYAQAQAQYGTTQIPINTFNKVWIMPDKATVWEHGKSVFVIERHLKVMLEEDYLASNKNNKPPSTLTSQIVRDIIIPTLEHEVNEGANFAQLRQIYNAMILATWYKKRLKDSVLGAIYMNKNKVKGIGYPTPSRGHVPEGAVSPSTLPSDQPLNPKASQGTNPTPNEIYQQYIQTFKKGVFNLIKEEPDPATGQMTTKRYFSGGMVGLDAAQLAIIDAPKSRLPDNAQAALPTDKAMKVTFDAVSVLPLTIASDKAMQVFPLNPPSHADMINIFKEVNAALASQSDPRHLLNLTPLLNRMTKLMPADLWKVFYGDFEASGVGIEDGAIRGQYPFMFNAVSTLNHDKKIYPMEVLLMATLLMLYTWDDTLESNQEVVHQWHAMIHAYNQSVELYNVQHQVDQVREEEPKVLFGKIDDVLLLNVCLSNFVSNLETLKKLSDNTYKLGDHAWQLKMAILDVMFMSIHFTRGYVRLDEVDFKSIRRPVAMLVNELKVEQDPVKRRSYERALACLLRAIAEGATEYNEDVSQEFVAWIIDIYGPNIESILQEQKVEDKGLSYPLGMFLFEYNSIFAAFNASSDVLINYASKESQKRIGQFIDRNALEHEERFAKWSTGINFFDVHEIKAHIDQVYTKAIAFYQQYKSDSPVAEIITHDEAMQASIEKAQQARQMQKNRVYLDGVLDELTGALDKLSFTDLEQIFENIKGKLSTNTRRNVLDEQKENLTVGQIALKTGLQNSSDAIGPLISLFAVSIYILDNKIVLDEKLVIKLQKVIDAYNNQLGRINSTFFRPKRGLGRMDIPLLFNLNLTAFTDDKNIRAYVNLSKATLDIATGRLKDDIVALSLFFMGAHLTRSATKLDALDYELLPAQIHYAIQRITQDPHAIETAHLRIGLTKLFSVGRYLITPQSTNSTETETFIEQIYDMLDEFGFDKVNAMVEEQHQKDLTVFFPMNEWRYLMNHRFLFFAHKSKTMTDFIFDHWSKETQQYLESRRESLDIELLARDTPQIISGYFENNYYRTLHFWQTLSKSSIVVRKQNAAVAQQEKEMKKNRAYVEDVLDELTAALDKLSYKDLERIFKKIKGRLSTNIRKDILDEQRRGYAFMGTPGFKPGVASLEDFSRPLVSLFAVSIYILDNKIMLDDKLVAKLQKAIDAYNNQLGEINSTFFKPKRGLGRMSIPLLFNFNLTALTVDKNIRAYVNLSKATLDIATGRLKDDIVALSLFFMGVHLKRSATGVDALDYELLPAQIRYAIQRIKQDPQSIGAIHLKIGLTKLFSVGRYLIAPQSSSSAKTKIYIQQISDMLHEFGLDKVNAMVKEQYQKDLTVFFPMNEWRYLMNYSFFFFAHKSKTIADFIFDHWSKNTQQYLKSREGLLDIDFFVRASPELMPKQFEKNYRPVLAYWKNVSDFAMQTFPQDKTVHPQQDSGINDKAMRADLLSIKKDQEGNTWEAIIQKEVPAALYALKQILVLRKYMDTHGQENVPLIVWQNITLGNMYPLFSERLKKALNITEISRQDIVRNKPIIGSSKIILVKAKFGSDGSLRDSGEFKFIDQLRQFVNVKNLAVVMIDHSPKYESFAQQFVGDWLRNDFHIDLKRIGFAIDLKTIPPQQKWFFINAGLWESVKAEKWVWQRSLLDDNHELAGWDHGTRWVTKDGSTFREEFAKALERAIMDSPDEDFKQLSQAFDVAMTGNQGHVVALQAKNPGGIDLNPNSLNLTIKRDADGMPLPTGQQDWAQVQISGVSPVIIKMERVNLQELLGG